ncbi:hypothetical protein BGX38DRAFT_1267987 [Terfezia claveryi]|nr:hypothetical protein BGX38DRAFT_1267987 [Terfezia claveryi]
MAGSSTSFGFDQEVHQLLDLNGTEVPTTQPGRSSLGYQPSCLLRCGASTLEAPSPPTDKLYRPFLAHLLQAHGGPSQTVSSQYFDLSIADFCSANVDSIKDVPEVSRDAEAEGKGEDEGLPNADQQRARYLAGRLLDLYDHTLQVGVKYQFVPPAGKCGSCRRNSSRLSIDSGVGTQGQTPLALESGPLNPPAGEWSTATYYSYPVPGPEAADIQKHVLRLSNHPCFEHPIAGCHNWRYRSLADCRGSLLTLTGWIPPTSCKVYRETLAEELYVTMLLCEEGQVLDADDTRVFNSWKDQRRTGPEAYRKVAWRVVAKIHKFHMFAEEVMGMKFAARVDAVKELCRLAKGTCNYMSKDGQMKNIIREPVAKIKTFTYNQASNKRKKERESDHVNLFEDKHGQKPPWKAAKRKQASVKPRARKGAEPTPEVIRAPTPEYCLAAGNVEEPTEGPETESAPRAATAKRKRATKAEQDNNDGPAPKSRANPAVRTINQRKLAPAPAPWVPELQLAPSRNGGLANNANHGVQRSPPYFYQSSNSLTSLPPPSLPSYSFQTLSLNQDLIGPGHGHVSSSHAQQNATQDQLFLQAPRTSSHDQEQLPFVQTSTPTSTHFSLQDFPPPDAPFNQHQFTNPFAQAQQQSYVGMNTNNISTCNSHYNAVAQYFNHENPPSTSEISLGPEASQIIRNADHGVSQFTAVSDFAMDNNFTGNGMSDEEFLESFSMFNPHV